MGPYYRGTSQGVGNFFELFYQHPVLMLLVVAASAAAGYFVWKRKKHSQASDG
ncbi:LPXTG cell wall anchor domain-containing protein [Methylomonas sp. MS20]|uniref:LPXTG cell wall anchor domain-containing protein n=1 Tax=Methylomonas sp. MS20 TaxID=3418769 RepID=UPI0014388022|nr:LPXTG cell wall anchor domain-containing protein [Methylococcaceae bacterium WWC4]